MKHGGFSLTVFHFWYTLGKASSEQEYSTVLSWDPCNAELGGCRGQSSQEDLGSWKPNLKASTDVLSPHPNQPRSRIRVADALMSLVD